MGIEGINLLEIFNKLEVAFIEDLNIETKKEVIDKSEYLHVHL
jgi:hypothetical protein